jgi:ankyrin repeat protein
MVLVARQSGPQKALAQSMAKAVISEDYAALKRHVDADADLELCEGSGWTPLILAAWYGQVDMLKLLIDAGASVQALDRNSWNAYHHACFGGHIECVELLLEHDVDVAALQSDGKTGRDMAISEKHERLVEVLIERGVPERDKPPEPPAEATNSTARAPKKRKRIEDDSPKGPKRALSAYMFFARDRRTVLLQEQPELRYVSHRLL